MRTHPHASFAVLVVLASACTRGTPVDAPAPTSGARVTSTSTSIEPESETSVTFTPGANARLIVAIGDRISELDLTPASATAGNVGDASAANAKQAEALVGFAPVKANESVTLRVRARPWTGADVLASFIAPLGGDAAVQGAVAAVPELAKGKMIAVQIDIITKSSVQSSVHNVVIAAGEHPGASTRFDVDGVVAFGAPLRVQDWVMASGDGYTPSISQTGSVLRASAPAGDVALEQLPAAAWTLWVQLEPEGA